MKKTILYVHQSADLYGSDRILLSLVQGLDRSRFEPIVVLPEKGPLFDAMQQSGVHVHSVPLAKLSRATLSPMGLLRLPGDVLASLDGLDRCLAGQPVHIVHSNTLAVLSGALWALRRRLPHVWHVHEIILHPTPVRRLFPQLLNWFSTRVVCNSKATEALLLAEQPNLAGRSEVFWNGLKRTEPVDHREVSALRRELGLGDNDVLVVLVGRINRWKGQQLLVQAAGHLWNAGVRNVHYLMVGSPPCGQESYRARLDEAIAASPARARISVLDFRANVWPVFDAADIVAVPSTEPEPFGMVALEAMAAGKPVVAAGHGGLAEIVQHGQTGLLFAPGCPLDLAGCLRDLIDNPVGRRSMGQAGLWRVKRVFSLDNYVSAFARLYEQL